MLPPLDIEIPSSSCWKEAAALRDVTDTDRLSPTGEDVDHVVTIKVSCLSGITAERPLSRDLSSSDASTLAPPDRMKAMIAVFRRCQALGSSGFSDPLSLSSSPMFADDSTARYVAMWTGFGGNGKADASASTVEFEVPLRVSHHMIEQEDFDLLVFLADHSEEFDGTVVAYPVGLGSFVLGDQCQSSNNSKAIDLRIKCLSESSRFPAVEVRLDQEEGSPAVTFTKTVSGNRLKEICSTYQLDARGGGFIRMNMSWCRKYPLPGLDPENSGVRESEEARSTESPEEVSPEDLFLQRTEQRRHGTNLSQDIFRRKSQITEPEQPQEKSDVRKTFSMQQEESDAARSIVAAKIVAKLKFPSRSSQKLQKSKVDLLISDDHEIKKEISEDNTKKEGLRYQIGNKVKKGPIKKNDGPRRLVDVEPVGLLSFDEESLMLELRPSSPPNGKLKRNASGVVSIEESTMHAAEMPKEFVTAQIILSKVLAYLESLVSCGNEKQTSDASVAAGSTMSLVDTWGTCEDDERTVETVENDDGLLAEIANSTWKAFDSDVNAVKNLLAPQTMKEKTKEKQKGRKEKKGRHRGRSRTTRSPVHNDSPTFWGEVSATARSDWCQHESGTISSLESKNIRKTKKGNHREHWV